jgi:hypothetical protein
VALGLDPAQLFLYMAARKFMEIEGASARPLQPYPLLPSINADKECRAWLARSIQNAINREEFIRAYQLHAVRVYIPKTQRANAITGGHVLPLPIPAPVPAPAPVPVPLPAPVHITDAIPLPLLGLYVAPAVPDVDVVGNPPTPAPLQLPVLTLKRKAANPPDAVPVGKRPAADSAPGEPAPRRRAMPPIIVEVA